MKKLDKQPVLVERSPKVAAHNALVVLRGKAVDKLCQQEVILHNLLDAVQANISAVRNTKREIIELDSAIRSIG